MKGKALSRAQKRRQERGLERAENVLDKTERKVERGMGRRRGGRERKVSGFLVRLGLRGGGFGEERGRLIGGGVGCLGGIEWED